VTLFESAVVAEIICTAAVALGTQRGSRSSIGHEDGAQARRGAGRRWGCAFLARAIEIDLMSKLRRRGDRSDVKRCVPGPCVDPAGRGVYVIIRKTQGREFAELWRDVAADTADDRRANSEHELADDREDRI
jgi:hypothetical protein